MTETGQTHGDRIREFFRSAEGDIAIIAPFIKERPFRSLLRVVPSNIHLRCVTRWLPRDVAAGVSDPEIVSVLEERRDYSLTLVDNLHAKLYIAGEDCLIGSPNVTFTGLGDNPDSNLEILISTTIHNPDVASTLVDITRAERTATPALAKAIRRLADSLPPHLANPIAKQMWFPRSRRPEHAFRLYTDPPTGYVGEVDNTLLVDVASSNIAPGLTEEGFRQRIARLLTAIPLAKRIIEVTEDTLFTRAEDYPDLGYPEVDGFSTGDLWLAFVNWMSFFFPEKVMKQEVTEVALRRAQLLK